MDLMGRPYRSSFDMPKPPDKSSFEWIRWIAGIVLGGVVVYYTTTGSMQAKISVLEERESLHYNQVMKEIGEIKSVVRDEIRRAIREEMSRQRRDPNGGGD